MSKTIEEAAKKAIIDNDFFMADPKHPDFVDRGLEQMRACKWVVNHIFSLPIASRLTSEEKERVRKVYKEAVEGKCELEKMQPQNTYAKNSIAMRIGVNMGCILTLESIFGADFFKDSPEK